ncbi:MAG: Vps62-related protein [Candidatus Zixiibacteriota bacterium]
MAEHCPNCIVNWCRTTYPTGGDYDGDGISDTYEMELARRFKPRLYYDQTNSELPFHMPEHYDVPPYSYESGVNHGMPLDIVSDGTIYVHVRPYGVIGPGEAFCIEIAYWYYFTYDQAECQAGYIGEHGHDWEHVALCLSVLPGEDSLQVVSIFFAHHDGWEYLGTDEVQWTGTPGLSSVKVYVVDGSHASYPSTGERCTFFMGICWCYENADGNGMYEIPDSNIINLYEVGDSRSPNWLDYSYKWPGVQTEFMGHKFFVYGPAWGNHAHWWNEGHFVNPYACIETWREDVDDPVNFQVSTFRNGHPLTNALYLTWDGPSGWDGFSLRRCLVSIPPNSNDPTCECLAQLGPNTFSYLDSCLDGGTTYYYELKTFNDNPNPAYRGCSWPALGQGTPSGNPCTEDMTPSRPVVRSCDSCILRWQDYSWNEDGFRIELYGDTCGFVGRNVEEYPVSNCCTSRKRSYQVIAFNQYGENSSTLGMCCNETPDCVPKLGCDGNQYQVPSMSQWGVMILAGLIIGTGVFLMRQQKETKRKVV